MSNLLDPGTATNPAFKRKAFVGLSVGAAAAASTLGGALAHETAGFGQPHPPIVAADDPTIVTERITLARPDIQLNAYAAWPKKLQPTTPGIVMVQHIWGVDSVLRDDVRRYAKAGFICIAPNLFERSHPPSGDGTSDIDLFRGAASALEPNVVHGDLLASRAWIAAKAPRAKIGITGFCMGGGIALRQLPGMTDYAAAVVFYGSVLPPTANGEPPPADPFAYASTIHTPVRGNYGERDTSIAPADVRAFFAKLSAPHELDIYPEAGHAFFDDMRKSYVASAAADAWPKTLAWFRTYLT